MKKAFLVLLCLTFATVLYADTIYLKDGTLVKGEITNEVADSVTLKEQINPAVAKIITIPSSEIVKIERDILKELLPAEEPSAKQSKKKGAAAKKEAAQLKKKEPAKEEAPQEVTDLKEEPKEEDVHFLYQVVKRKDKSYLGFIKMKRIETTIAVSMLPTKEKLQLIFEDVLKEEFRTSPDLDALWIIAYSQRSYPSGVPKAYAIWSPQGGWDDFTHRLEKSNYRWEYRYLIP